MITDKVPNCSVLYCTVFCTVSCTISCTVLYKVRDDDEAAEVEGDWKFAAMVLDRSAGVSLGSAGGQLGVIDNISFYITARYI